MRQTDFDYLCSAVDSLTGSTDRLFWCGWIRVIETGMNSPYRSRRKIEYEGALAPADDVLIVANRRRIIVVDVRGTVFSATEKVEKALPKIPFQPVEGWGWDGPRAEWTVQRISRFAGSGLLNSLIERAVHLGAVPPAWNPRDFSLVTVAFPVPVVVGWDGDGRPLFDYGSPTPVESDAAVDGEKFVTAR